MKYAKPRMFKAGLEELIAFIDANNGIDHNDEEWQKDVREIRNAYIDPKDFQKFDVEVEKLEIIGLCLREAYDYLDKTIVSFQKTSGKMLKRIKNK